VSRQNWTLHIAEERTEALKSMFLNGYAEHLNSWISTSVTPSSPKTALEEDSYAFRRAGWEIKLELEKEDILIDKKALELKII